MAAYADGVIVSSAFVKAPLLMPEPRGRCGSSGSSGSRIGNRRSGALKPVPRVDLSAQNRAVAGPAVRLVLAKDSCLCGHRQAVRTRWRQASDSGVSNLSAGGLRYWDGAYRSSRSRWGCYCCWAFHSLGSTRERSAHGCLYRRNRERLGARLLDRLWLLRWRRRRLPEGLNERYPPRSFEM